MMHTQIRVLQDTDIPQLEKLFKETVTEDFPEYGSKTIAYFTSGTYIQEMIGCPIRLGAFINGTLVGYLIGNNPFGGIIFLQWLAIDKKFRGKGIGKQLLQAAEPIGLNKGAHALHLMSDPRNVQFYEKCGYEVYGRDTKGYFGSDDYLLRKMIAEPNEKKYFQQ